MGFQPPKWFARTLLFFGLLALLGLLAWAQNQYISTPFTVEKKLKPARRIFPDGKKKHIERTHTLPVASPVVINEIGLAEPLGPTRADGAPADWIELYNRSAKPVSLAGYSLTDSATKARKFIFPDILLPAQTPLIVWADGETGITSPLLFKYVASDERNAWERRPDLSVAAGYAWFYDSAVDHPGSAGPSLGFVIQVPDEGDYSLWVKHHPSGQKNWILEAAVDGTQTVATYQRPRQRYMMSRLRNPDDRDGFWRLAPGEHTVRLTLLEGATSVDYVVLTRKGERYGAGYQDVHAPFKLRRAGELVALHSPRGLPLDYVTFPGLSEGQTYARAPVGKGSFRVTLPSPSERPLPRRLAIEPGSGFTAAGTPVRLSAQPDAVVHYTLDGQMPTTNSPLYTAPLIISNSTALRARAFLPGACPGPTANAVYWVGERPAIPVFWALMRPRDLQSAARGLLSNTSSRGLPGERPCYACMLYPDGTVQETGAGIRLQGRSTRRMSVKKSFRIFCRPRYGNPEWPGALFGETPPTRHSSFVLIGHSVVNHPIGLEVMDAIGTLTPRVRHVLFQINNQPMGIYILVEDPNDETYLAQLFGHLDLDIIKHKTLDAVKQGDETDYHATWTALAEGPATNITLERFSQIMDPDEFIRWIAGIQYLGMEDNGQGYFVRDKTKAPPAWTLINWDMDGSLAINSFHRRRLQTVFGLRGDLHKELLADPEYCARYIDIFQQLLNHPLKPETWTARIGEYAATLLPQTGFDYLGQAFQESRLVRNLTPDELYYAYEDVYKNSYLFFEQQNEGARRVLNRDFALGNYVQVRVLGEEGREIIIDGYAESLPYEGLYFPGSALTVSSGAPDHLSVTYDGATLQTNTLRIVIANTLDVTVH
ncbi:MAG: hypothetical protein EOM20_15915 [Spartobacteria bacterium]|nr:hypothetical protein [Spartobacteria bacterium]